MKKTNDPKSLNPEAVETSKLIGYMRVSTDDQNLNLQKDALIAFGVADRDIYSDKKSGATMDRPGWKDCMADLRRGDTLVVWKLDRLGRSLADLVKTVDGFRDEGIEFVVITQQFDTRTAMGRLIFGIFAILAEFERAMVSERTKAGIEARKARGLHVGRKSRWTPELRKAAVDVLRADANAIPTRVSEAVNAEAERQNEGKPKKDRILPPTYNTVRACMEDLQREAAFNGEKPEQ